MCNWFEQLIKRKIIINYLNWHLSLIFIYSYSYPNEFITSIVNYVIKNNFKQMLNKSFYGLNLKITL